MAIILQIIHTLNYYVVHPKLMQCYMSAICQYNWESFLNKRVKFFFKKPIQAIQVIAVTHWETLTQWRQKAFCEF